MCSTSSTDSGVPAGYEFGNGEKPCRSVRGFFIFALALVGEETLFTGVVELDIGDLVY